MLDELKYYDGSVQAIERIPDEIKERYPTAFEVDPQWLIACAARRQKWIDMGQSLNLYMAEPSGTQAERACTCSAWRQGLKTTYYLRSRGATQVEKSTHRRQPLRHPAALDEAPAAPRPRSPMQREDAGRRRQSCSLRRRTAACPTTLDRAQRRPRVR